MRGVRALALASVFTLPVAAQTPSPSPSGGQVAVGAATISSQGGQTQINQTSDKALIDWRSFDIGAGQSVTVTQPGATSLLVNRVNGTGTGTRIDGSLTANGQVVIIDRAGILIGRNARIDAGAFLASTADIDNADFAAGRLFFGKAGDANAAISHDGIIRVADGGYVALAAPNVINHGIVEARLGRVVMAGVERFTLDLAGDGLLRFELPGDVAGRIVNEGSIRADGGSLQMTAQAARDGMAGVINAGGLVEATSAHEVDGRIIIGGDGVETLVTGDIRADGGAVDVLGAKITLSGAHIDVSGADGGGTIHIGGDFQGQGDRARSDLTRIDAASVLRADALASGDGGQIIVWSDGITDYHGQISAKGQRDGGFAEVSGKGLLNFAGTADLAAGTGGKAGTLLLDPTNITIGNTANIDGDGTTGDDLDNSGDLDSTSDFSGTDSLITASAVAALLNAGTSVTLAASNDITLSSSIAKTAGTNATLTLNAGGDISVASGVGVTSTSNALSMGFTASGQITATGGSFTSNGGSINLTGNGGGSAAVGIDLSGVTLSSGGGSLQLTGTGAIGVRISGGAITGSGGITVTGSSAGGTSNAYGIELGGGGTLIGGNDVSLTGTGGGNSGSANHGVMIHGGYRAAAGSSSLTVTAIGGSGSIGLDNAIDSSAIFGGSGQSGTVTLNADGMDLTGISVTTTGTARLRAYSSGIALDLGSASDSSGGPLSLSQAELDKVTADTLQLGSTSGGTITIASTINPAHVVAVELHASSISVGSDMASAIQTMLNVGTDVNLTSGGTLTLATGIAKTAGGAASLSLRADGNIDVDAGIGVTSTTGTLSMNFQAGYSGGTGSFTTAGTGTETFTSNGGSISIGANTNLSLSGATLTSGNAAITLSANDIDLASTNLTGGSGTITLSGDDIDLASSTLTSTGRVWLRQRSDNRAMKLEATSTGSHLSLSQAELTQVSAGTLRLGSLSGGATQVNETLTYASNVVELASGGAVTQSTAIDVTSLALLGSGGSYTLTNAGNSVSTLALNTGSATFISDVALSIGTVASTTTGLTFTGTVNLSSTGGAITLGQSATYTGSGGGSLTLGSDTNVAVNANISATGAGALSLVLNADKDANSTGAIALASASIDTNGGNITMGGGATPSSIAAIGGSTNGIGVSISGTSTVNADGGNILIHGQGAASGTNAGTGIGIDITDSNLTTTGSGTIILNGKGGAGNSLTAGVGIGDGSVISTANGAITITGEEAATGTNAYGVLLRDDDAGDKTRIYSTGGGGVSIIATGTEGTLSAYTSGASFSQAFIGWDGTTAYGGAITLTADDMTLSNGSNGTAISIGGTGTLTLQPYSTGTSVGVGDTGQFAATLEIGDIEIAAFRTGFTGITIGRSDGTGTVTVHGATFKDNVTFQAGSGALTVSGAISTGSGNDAGTINLISTGLMSISGDLTTQNNNITLSTDNLSLTGSIDAGTAIATVTPATASRTIDLGSTGSSTTGLDISLTELNKVEAGTIRIGSSTAGALTISSAITPAGTSVLHLRSGAGITQSAALTVTSLAVSSAGNVALAGTDNAVTNLAISATNSAVAFRDDTGFAIGTVDGVAGMAAGIGTITLTSTGTVTQTASITGAGLALTGTGGAYTLAHASNAVTTLAANTGSVDVGLSAATNIGTLGSTIGVTATGTVKISANGHLTIASGASVTAVGSGDALILAANGNFTNSAGSSSLIVTGGGRFLVFSNAPSTSSTGGVTAKPFYNRTYDFTNRTHSAVASTGNRFVYSHAPTLTITANAITKTYDGVAPTPTYTATGLVTGDTLADALAGAPSLTGSVAIAGTHTLTAALGTLTSDLNYGFGFVTGTLTIDTKALTYAVANSSSTYGTVATNGTITLTGVVDGDEVAGTITTYRGSDPVTLVARTGVGSLTQRVTALTGDDAANYTIAGSGNSDGTLTIGQKALTYVINAANSVYGTLATLGTATLTGVVTDDVVTNTVSLASATLTDRLAAGTYAQAVTLTGADAANYSLSGTGNSIGNLVIARKDLTYSIADATSIYGTLATPDPATLTGVLSGDTVTGTPVLSGATLAERLAAGSYTLTLTGLAGATADNYQIASTGNQNATLTVNRKSLTGVMNAVSATYGDGVSTGTVTLTGVLSGDGVTTSVVVEGSSGTVSPGPTLAAGAYTQRVTALTGSAAANYQLTGGDITAAMTISPRPLSVVAGTLTRIYGKADPDLTYSSNGLVNGDTLSGAITRAPGNNVGTYAITQGSLTASANYTLTFTAGSLSINPAPLTVTAASATRVYGTADTGPTYTAIGLITGDSISGELVRAPGKDVGTYAITQGTVTAGTNYTLTYVPGALSITPAPLSILAGSATKVYGTADPAFTYTATGLVTGDSLSGTLARAPGKDVGTYAITQGTLSAGPNYTVTYTGGTLSITPAKAIVMANSQTKLYGAADPALTYSASGLVAGDSLSGELARASGKDVGTYAISQGSLSGGANYTITFAGGTLTINPAPLSVAAASLSKLYGAADPALTYSASGLAVGDSLSGELSRAPGKDVGTYAISQGSLSAGSNYILTFTDGALTINPAPLNVTAASLAKLYGAADPALTYSASGLVAGDSLSGALVRASGKDVGTYAISQGSLAAGPNYILTFTAGALTIDPAPLSITALAATKRYGEADPALTYQAAGFVAGDGASILTGGLSRTGGENAGTYAINQGSLSAGTNYTIAFTGADLVIERLAVALSVTAASLSKIYGDEDPALTYSVSGLLPEDSASTVLTGSLTRAVGEDAGTYAISQGNLSLANPNYILSFTGGTLTILPAPLSVVAGQFSRTYGDADPALTYGVSGLKRGDSAEAVLTGALARVAGEDAGTYTVGRGTLAATGGNYTLSVTDGRLTINPATLSVTATAQSRPYGGTDPALAFTASGLRRTDTAGSVLTGALARVAGNNAGRYAINQGTLAANANYRISFQGAELTITPVALSVLVDNATRQQGAANPVFTARYTGLVAGDNAASLTGLRITTGADATSPAGTYAISAGGATNTNYQITYVDGQLTVTGGGVLPPDVAEAAPVTTITQPVRPPTPPAVIAAAPAPPAAAPPTAPPPPAAAPPVATVDAGSAALAAASQSVQSASGSAADEESATEEMIPGLLSQQRRLPGQVPDGTPGLEQQFPNLGRVW